MAEGVINMFSLHDWSSSVVRIYTPTHFVDSATPLTAH